MSTLKFRGFPMHMRLRSIPFITAAVVAFLWIIGVTHVTWNLDPKFGGPHRWATFAIPEYWLASLLPSTTLIALALAAERRWQLMRTGAESYRYLGDVSAPGVVAALVSVVITSYEGSFRVELLELNYPWRNLQYPALILLGIFACLLAPVSTLVWIILAIGYAVLFLVGGLSDVIANGTV